MTHKMVSTSAVSKMKPVDGKFTIEFESAVITGIPVIVENEEEKIEALRLICERFTPDNMGDFDNAVSRSLGITAIIRIDILTATGKMKI